MSYVEASSGDVAEWCVLAAAQAVLKWQKRCLKHQEKWAPRSRFARWFCSARAEIDEARNTYDFEVHNVRRLERLAALGPKMLLDEADMRLLRRLLQPIGVKAFIQ